jgi:hypothetical protein
LLSNFFTKKSKRKEKNTNKSIKAKRYIAKLNSQESCEENQYFKFKYLSINYFLVQHKGQKKYFFQNSLLHFVHLFIKFSQHFQQNLSSKETISWHFMQCSF